MTETAAVYKSEDRTPNIYAVVALGVTEQDIKTLIAEKADKKLIPGDKNSYLEVKSALMDFVHVRNKIDDRRKEINRETNDKAKKLLALLDPHEKALRIQVEKEDARLAAIKAEEERKEKERKDTIKMQLDKIRAMGLITALTPSADIKARIDKVFELKNFSFQEFTDEMETMTDEIMGTLSVALTNRQEFERKEAEQKARDEAQKAEAERLAKEKAELERQKAELEANTQKAIKDRTDAIIAMNIETNRGEPPFTQPQDAPKEKAGESLPPRETTQPAPMPVTENQKTEAKDDKTPGLKVDIEKIITWATLLINMQPPAVLTNSAYKITTDGIAKIHKAAQEMKEKAEAL